MNWIESLDHSLFLLINGAHNVFLDSCMASLSNKTTWIPLYVILLLALKSNRNAKSFAVVLLMCLITIGLCDFISVHGFKEVFMRYRPCHHLQLSQAVHLLGNHCGGKYGFVSSHAANHFGIATMMVLNLKTPFRYGLLLWAFAVAYSRVYLGVHYPLDVLGGALLGISIAFVVQKMGIGLLKKYSTIVI